MMTRVRAQFRKELVQLRRDRVGLILAIVLPVFSMLLLGTALSLTVSNIPIVVQDLDQTPRSLQLLDAFRSSLTFRVVSWPIDRQPEDALRAGQARAAVVIPEHFERDMLLHRAPTVQMLIDATDANTANVLRGSVSGVVSAYNQAQGLSRPAIILGDVRLWYNPGRSDQAYIGPGAMVISLALMPPLLACLALSRERDSGTILQVFVSGVSALEFVTGKVAAYVCVAAVDWGLEVVLAYTVFGLHLQGDPTAFLVGTFCFLFSIISYGALVGSRIADQPQAVQAMQLTGFVLSMLLSGFIFPLSNIPVQLRWISAIVPARYYLEIVRDAFLRGAGWPTVWWAVLALAALGAFNFWQAWRRMRPMQVDVS